MSDCCRPPEDPDAPRRRVHWRPIAGVLFLVAVVVAVVLLNA